MMPETIRDLLTEQRDRYQARIEQARYTARQAQQAIREANDDLAKYTILVRDINTALEDPTNTTELDLPVNNDETETP